MRAVPAAVEAGSPVPIATSFVRVSARKLSLGLFTSGRMARRGGDDTFASSVAPLAGVLPRTTPPRWRTPRPRSVARKRVPAVISGRAASAPDAVWLRLVVSPDSGEE